MEGIKSSVVLFALLLAIFGPTVTFGNKRTCFCETRGHPSGESSDAFSLLEIPNRVYRGWPYLGCSSPKTRCPRECKQDVLRALGGSSSRFTDAAGNRVCRIYGQNTSCQGISVVAKYVVSNCGKRDTLELANVCCALPRFRCSCDLMASMEGSFYDPLPLTPYIGAYRGPYYDCKENINSDCKDECIKHYRRILGGNISPKYENTASDEMCRVLDTILPATYRDRMYYTYSAQVNIRYSSGVGDPQIEALEELCCVALPEIDIITAVSEC